MVAEDANPTAELAQDKREDPRAGVPEILERSTFPEAMHPSKNRWPVLPNQVVLCGSINTYPMPGFALVEKQIPTYRQGMLP
jgi:hypothetical protein